MPTKTPNLPLSDKTKKDQRSNRLRGDWGRGYTTEQGQGMKFLGPGNTGKNPERRRPLNEYASKKVPEVCQLFGKIKENEKVPRVGKPQGRGESP